MLALQAVAGLRVVESLFGRQPVDNLEVRAVVLGMASDTLVVIGLLHNAGVIAGVRHDPAGNFRVAAQAFEAPASARQPVAGSAFCGPAQELVGPGKRPRRNLRP